MGIGSFSPQWGICAPVGVRESPPDEISYIERQILNLNQIHLDDYVT